MVLPEVTTSVVTVTNKFVTSGGVITLRFHTQKENRVRNKSHPTPGITVRLLFARGTTSLANR